MTRSPILSTFIPLLPLVALGWPLTTVLTQEDYQAVEPELSKPSSIVSGDLFAQSAHPFSTISVSIDGATWTFSADDYMKEIHFPQGEEVALTISITWPEGTPETAVLFTLQADQKTDKTQTLWGIGEVTEELIFTWEDQP